VSPGRAGSFPNLTGWSDPRSRVIDVSGTRAPTGKGPVSAGPGRAGVKVGLCRD